MEASANNFPEYTKKQWLVLIEKSLRSGTINDFQWKISEDILAMPFAHRDDLKNDPEPMGVNKKDNEWLIGCSIDTKEMNAELYACQALDFQNMDQIDRLLDSLSNKVNALLEIRVPMTEFEKWFSWISQYDARGPWFKNLSWGFVVNKDLNVNLKDIVEKISKQVVDWFIVLNVPLIDNDQGLSDALADYFINWMTVLEQLNTIYSEQNLAYRLRMGHVLDSGNFLFETALIRAFKLLSYNIQSAIGLEADDLRVDAILRTDLLSDDKNHQLILATAASVAAVMGGIHSLYIGDQTISDLEQQRLFRNIQLLLKEEAGMADVVDPAAGSFAIEHLTIVLAETIWSKIMDISER